jgi:hypothetical protein
VFRDEIWSFCSLTQQMWGAGRDVSHDEISKGIFC